MDLDPGAGGSVSYQIQGSPGSQTAIIQFQQCRPPPPPPRLGILQLEALLHEGSNDLEVQYLSTSTSDSNSSGANAVASLRSAFDCPNRKASLPFSCVSPILTDGLSLYYAYPASEPACGTTTTTQSFTQSPTFSASPTQTMSFTFSPTFTPTPTASPSPSATPSTTATASPSSNTAPTYPQAQASPTQSFPAEPSPKAPQPRLRRR